MPDESPLRGISMSIEQIKEICGISVGFRWLLGCSQVDCGLHDHFGTTVAHLSPKCAIFVAFPFSLFTFQVSFFPKGYRTLTEGAFEYEQEEYKKLTPPVQLMSGGVRVLFNDMCFLIQLESPKKYQLES